MLRKEEDMTRLNHKPSERIANDLVPFEPTHPGEILNEELEERGIARSLLAQQIGKSEETINGIIDEKEPVTAELAMLFEAALGINADFWLNMQKKYEKDLVALDAKFMKHLAEIRKLVAML